MGLRGIRIQNIVNELHGEKIDVVQWDENPIVFISQALSPSQVLRVDLVQDDLSATAVVPENTLSLAIGKEGQNARLAAKLTGWKVDIKSNVEVADKEPLGPVTATKVTKEKPVTPKVTEAVEETSITEAKEAQEEEPPVQDDGDEVVESTDVAETGDTEVVQDTESTTEDSSEEKELIAAVAEASGEQEDTETEDESLESAAELSEEVWNIRKPSVPVDPGQIRFAEDIEELFKNGPAKRRGTRKQRPRTNRTARKK